MHKKMMALLLALCLTVSGAAAFSDVAEGAWYYQEVQQVSQEGLMSGVSTGEFAPGVSVTRGMVVTVLYRMEGTPATTQVASFSDVTAGEWYADAAAWAQTAQIASGYDGGTFGPKDNVTREQLAVFLWRYAQYKGMELADGVLGGFEDSEHISAWAQEGMAHTVGAGLITGTSDGQLKPNGVATRAQLAVILCRLLTPVAG